jgi:hypothetical protein
MYRVQRTFATRPAVEETFPGDDGLAANAPRC